MPKRRSEPTRLERLYQLRLSLLESLVVVDREIHVQGSRVHNERQRYEQRKARGQCASKASCKSAPVPGYTCCAYHLRKQAEATEKYRRPRKGFA